MQSTGFKTETFASIENIITVTMVTITQVNWSSTSPTILPTKW